MPFNMKSAQTKSTPLSSTMISAQAPAFSVSLSPGGSVQPFLASAKKTYPYNLGNSNKTWRS